MNLKHVDKVFVCHHAPLAGRKQYIERALSEQKIDFEFIQSYDPSMLEEYYDEPSCKIKKSELSLYLKHKEIFARIVVWEIPTTLILEDDALIDSNFSDIIDGCACELKEKKGEMCFVGVCCNLHLITNPPANLIYTSGSNTTRCTHAYLLTFDGASKIISYPLLEVYDKPIDHKLNDVILGQQIKNYWYEPGIPQNSQFECSLRKD